MEQFFTPLPCLAPVPFPQSLVSQWALLVSFYPSVSSCPRDLSKRQLPLSYLDIDDFDKALERFFTGRATILNRMRLACTFYDKESVKKKDQSGSDPLNVGPPNTTDDDSDWQVMNEIALHRGSSPHLNTIDIFVDGQHLTEAVVCVFGLQMCST
jgi:hypothetical protein